MSTDVIEDGKRRSLAQDTQIKLEFGDDGRLRAGAGCDTIDARVSFDGGGMEVSDLSVADADCEPALNEQDAWVVAFLKSGPLWSVRDHTLALQMGATRIMFDEGAYGLTGTRWVVEELIDGGTTSTAPAGVEATLVFATASVSIDTGCNEGTANVSFVASSVIVQPPALTKKVCAADVMAFENALLTTLTEGYLGYQISGTALELKAQERSLVLKASS